MHLDYTKVIILILWWRNFQLEYWRTFQLVSTIIGGIYYLILHDKLSTFSGIDLKKESDKQKVIKAISKLSDILFTFIPSSITKENIDIIIKMREDNIPVEKIAYYTGIPKEIIVSI